MSRIIRKADRVDDDLREYYFYILSDKLAPAERLFAVADASFKRLAETPYIGRKVPTERYMGRVLRSYPMPPPYRNYLVVYEVLPDTVYIVAVVHGALDLGRVIRQLE